MSRPQPGKYRRFAHGHYRRRVGYIHQALRQAYVSARLADLPPALTRESDGIGPDARLYIVPSVKQLLAPTWLELENGGVAVELTNPVLAKLPMS